MSRRERPASSAVPDEADEVMVLDDAGNVERRERMQRPNSSDDVVVDLEAEGSAERGGSSLSRPRKRMRLAGGSPQVARATPVVDLSRSPTGPRRVRPCRPRGSRDYPLGTVDLVDDSDVVCVEDSSVENLSSRRAGRAGSSSMRAPTTHRNSQATIFRPPRWAASDGRGEVTPSVYGGVPANRREPALSAHRNTLRRSRHEFLHFLPESEGDDDDDDDEDDFNEGQDIMDSVRDEGRAAIDVDGAGDTDVEIVGTEPAPSSNSRAWRGGASDFGRLAELGMLHAPHRNDSFLAQQRRELEAYSRQRAVNQAEANSQQRYYDSQAFQPAVRPRGRSLRSFADGEHLDEPDARTASSTARTPHALLLDHQRSRRQRQADQLDELRQLQAQMQHDQLERMHARVAAQNRALAGASSRRVNPGMGSSFAGSLPSYGSSLRTWLAAAGGPSLQQADMSYEQMLALDDTVSKKRLAASRKDISKIAIQKASPADSSERCCICLCDIEVGEKIRVLPCPGSHRFHANCVKEWLTHNGCCPIDKIRIDGKNFD